MPRDVFGANFGALGQDDDGLGPLGARRQRARFPAAPAAVAEPAKASLVDRGVTGLHYLASALDKPGRAVRGALTGNVREFLGAAIPFSDSLGITDPKQAVSGEGVLEHYGLMDPLKPGEEHPGFFSGRNLAGLGASVALDPLTYASFGTSALTKAGQAARAAGATRGWGHEALIKGFDQTTDALRASGMGDDAIAHLGRSGQRIAPAGLGVQANRPLAGAVGFGLPFAEPAFTVGHGAASRAVAGGFDRLWDGLKFAPGVRGVRQWLDTGAGRSNQAIAQRAHEAAAAPLTRQLRGETGVWEYGARHRLGAVSGPTAPLGTEMEGLNLIGGEAERVAQAVDPAAWQADFQARHAAGLAPGVSDPAALQAHVLAHFGQYQQIGREINAGGKKFIEQARYHGADPHVLADAEAEYARRQYVAGAQGAGHLPSRPVQPFNTAGMYDRARQEVLKDVPGGTNAINRWAIDPRLSGPARTLNPAQARAVLLNDMIGLRRRAAAGPPVGPELMALHQKSRHLESFLGDLDPLHAANQVPFYAPDRVADFVARSNAHAQVAGAAAGAVEGLASGAIPRADFAAGGRFAGQAHVPLDVAMKRVGLTTHRPYAPADPADLAHLAGLGLRDADHARQVLRDATTDPAAMAIAAQIPPDVAARLGRRGFDGGAARLYEQMARHGAPLEDLTTGSFDPTKYLRDYAVHEKDAHALSEYMTGFTVPHEAKNFLGGLDSLQNLFKAFTYPIWPASHVRNAVSAAYNNAIHGTGPGAYRDAYEIMRGRGVGHHAGYGPALAAMTPEARAAELTAGAFGHGGVFTGGSFNEVTRNAGLGQIDTLSGEAGKLAPGVPGAGRATPGNNLVQDFGGIFGEMGRGLATKAGRNPLNVRGVGGRTDDAFAPLVAGRKVGENVEDFARLANYLGNLRKGMTPGVAGDLTKRIHFDYGDLTPMESHYLRKLFPFYTFFRKNLPEQARLLGTRPSAIAPTVRAMAGGDHANREDFVPPYLASGPAINLGHAAGPNGEDFTRFLTSFGLPIEEAAERMKFVQRDVGPFRATLPDLLGTAQGYLGMVNGYMKAPLEMMTDTQLHTGRRLSDLYRPTPWNLYGRIDGPVGDTLSELGQNLPGTRFATTFNKLIDDRKPGWAKALNLLTGVKISDVDTDKAYNIEARKQADEIARQDPRLAAFTNFYVKPDQADKVDPALADFLRLRSRMTIEAHDAAEARKRQMMLRQIEQAGKF